MATAASSVRVAVIGAGASGLAALRQLTRLGLTVRAFERAEAAGGTWLYTDAADPDAMGDPQRGSMYDALHTNLPTDVMAHLDFPFSHGVPSFPHREHVLRYIQDFARHYDLLRHVTFRTTVERVDEPDWMVHVRGADGTPRSEAFHAVVVCNGHYSLPSHPRIEGVAGFAGEVLHSHNYRRPDGFAGKRVLVVGAGNSGVDISLELLPVAAKVLLSAKGDVPAAGEAAAHDRPRVHHKPQVVRARAPDAVEFADGSTERVDVLLLCTGYQYHFPFLPPALFAPPPCGLTDHKAAASPPPRVGYRGSFVRPLLHHVFHADLPSLAFVGLPFKVAPFRLADYQAAWVARVLAGEQRLPAAADMHRAIAAWETQLETGARALQHYHMFGPYQWEYTAMLAPLGGLPAPEPLVEHMYADVSAARRRAPATYRARQYGLDAGAGRWWVVTEEGETQVHDREEAARASAACGPVDMFGA